MSLKSTFKKFNPLSKSSSPTPTGANAFIFPTTTPDLDGEDCLRDCDTCTVHLPRSWKIEETDALYGEINGWSRHVVVATGKTDWVRDVEDEKGSVMEAVGRWKDEHEKGGKKDPGKLMLSASNMPLPEHRDDHASTKESVQEQQSGGTTVLLLPRFALLEHVTPKSVPGLLGSEFFTQGPTNTAALEKAQGMQAGALPEGVTVRECPHDYLILLCSQKTRDARCGQSAPLLKREFERHLRPLGLYRDLDDERPGGVGIYFVSHVGGHKYSANVMIYRSTKAAPADGESTGESTGKDNEANAGTSVEQKGEETIEEGLTKEAAQCIWIARVRPEDCENIVRYTVLKGKVVKPQRQLRGGFDRYKGITSW